MSNTFKILEREFEACKKRSVIRQKNGKHLLAGYNAGIYPQHRFAFLPAVSEEQKHLPLRVVFAGCDQWDQDCFRYRQESDTFALELVTMGEFEFEQRHRIYRLGPGDVFIVQPHQDSAMRNAHAAPAQKQTVAMAGTLLAPLLTTLRLDGCDTIHPAAPAAIRTRFTAIAAELAEKRSGFEHRCHAMGYELLLALAAEAKSTEAPPELQPILNFIDHHLAEKLSIGRLTREFKLSASTLHRLFRLHLGDTPANCIIRKRMQLAEALLRLSEAPIKEIADAVGYENPLYFSAEFHRYSGSSPSRYRNQSQLP